MRANIELFVVMTILVSEVIGNHEPEERNHKKRQIYREQVLPHAGGKIPDTAFQADRLFLNRLQKQGISIPDGIVAEQRDPDVAPYQNRASRPVYRVALSSDGRITAHGGRFYFQSPASVDTTYLLPQIHNQAFRYPSKIPAYQLHNTRLNQVNLQPTKNNQHPAYWHNAAINGWNTVELYGKPQSRQNYNFLSDSPLSSTYLVIHQYPPNYGSTHLVNEFDDLFNNFDLHKKSS